MGEQELDDPHTSSSKFLVYGAWESTQHHFHDYRRAPIPSHKELDQSHWSPLRKLVAGFVESRLFEVCMGVLITFNVVILVIEVDSNKSCSAVEQDSCAPSKVVEFLNQLLLSIYTLEITLRVFAYRGWFFCGTGNLLDAFIVLIGIFDVMMSYGGLSLPNLQMFRMFRLLKLLRTVRLLMYFPELYELVRGFAGALKAMLWGAFLIGIMLGIWSLLVVEVVPHNESTTEGDWCDEAFSSVFMTTLFFFQTLVAGDSWGECTIPIIKKHPEVVVIFVGALVSVQLGFANLVLAVIVDAAASAREKDHEHRLREKKKREHAGLEHWRTVVESLDVDNSGTISLEELMTGFETQPEVMKCFDLLDVDQKDLESFFRLMDSDESGDLSYKEFFHCLRKAHTQDIRMYLMNVKLQISRISHLLSKQLQSMNDGFQLLTEKVALASPNAQALDKPHEPFCGAEAESVVVGQVPEGGPPPVLEDNAADKDFEVGVAAEGDDFHDLPPPPETAVTSHMQALAQVCTGALNRVCEKLEVQLEKLVKDAGAQGALLAQHTKLLEALLSDLSDDRNCTASSPVESSSTKSTSRPSARKASKDSAPRPTARHGNQLLGNQLLGYVSDESSTRPASARNHRLFTYGGTSEVSGTVPARQGGRLPTDWAERCLREGRRASPSWARAASAFLGSRGARGASPSQTTCSRQPQLLTDVESNSRDGVDCFTV